MAIPDYESHTSALGLSITEPSGTATGDLLLIFVGTDAGSSSFSLSGWSELHDTQGTGFAAACYWRIADGSEAWPYVVTSSDGVGTEVISCIRISGADGTTPIDGHAVNDPATSQSPIAPDYTTTQDDCLVIRWTAIDKDTLSGTPSTEIFNVDQGNTTHAASHEDKVTAGAVGTATFTGANDNYIAVTVAIAPAGGGGGGATIPIFHKHYQSLRAS